VIEARLSDRSLNPADAAAAAGVSIRYANAVLSDEGLSIGELIQSRRLTRCREALADTQQSHRTIKEIAMGWGFSDMTHFGRRFKAISGMAPREYRRMASQKNNQTAPTDQQRES
jgi:AraC family transcriptional regulator, positive regulator of tynA and feaB